MSELNALFHKRIDISKNKKITFETLNRVLDKTAKTIPFESLSIIENKTNDITKENVVNKILVKKKKGVFVIN